MKLHHKSLIVTLIISLVLLGGCTKRYTITCDLNEHFEPTSTCVIGSIVDELPIDTEEAKKPSAEDIAKFKNYLLEEIEKEDIITLLGQDADSTDYEIKGSILDYKKGSGAVRFFIGLGLGDAKCIVNMRLVDGSTGLTVFGGNFTATVSSWAESGDKIFRQISKDFTKELKKQLKKLAKEA